jgi:hypothetical protein
VPSSPNRFASITRRLEELPSDGGQAVDTLAGANLRIFMRLHQLEAALARVTRRVEALEGGTEPAKAGNGAIGAGEAPPRPSVADLPDRKNKGV